jgi:hypothetical protein
LPATAPEGAQTVTPLSRPSARSDDRSTGKDAQSALTHDGGLALELPSTLVENLARRAAEIVGEENAGFLDVKGAAEFLGGWSKKRIYNLVERDVIPYYKPHGRLLFDPRELRDWVTEEGS